MLDPNKVEVGDRLKWIYQGGCYIVKVGHMATVSRSPWKEGAWWVNIKWDSGTTQNDGSYELKHFELVDKPISQTVLNYEPCVCTKPTLIKNSVGGKEFLYCRICGKERPNLFKET